jgi:hypothetical protein
LRIFVVDGWADLSLVLLRDEGDDTCGTAKGFGKRVEEC